MAMEGEVGPDEADPHAGGEADADVDPRPGVDSADEEPGEAVEGEDDRVAGAALMCEFVRQAVARKSTVHPPVLFAGHSVASTLPMVLKW